MKCRHCLADLQHTFLDLGYAPPSNAYLNLEDLNKPETYFPLRVKVCEKCWLTQTEDYAEADALFSRDYAYFSSASKTWLEHAECFATEITQELKLTVDSLVVEIASNDGYLLKNFVKKNIPCLGIEPTISTAVAAEQLGIPVVREFFGGNLAQNLVAQGKKADLIVGNNVYAHVPDINDFTKGIQVILKAGGTICLEFPHLLNLLLLNQFDTVYHEHFSYLSLGVVQQIFAKNGLRIFDVRTLTTHGGSLRVYGCHQNDQRVSHNRVNEMLAVEKEQGLNSLNTYLAFQKKADKVKDELLTFLLNAKCDSKKVAAYGAAAKGNTLLNYAGVKPDLLSFVCDGAKSKQGKYLPGSHIPIYAPDKLVAFAPDYVVVLPWNLIDEVQTLLRPQLGLKVKFITAVPQLQIL